MKKTTHPPGPSGVADVDVHFGPYTLNLGRRVLRKDGRTVRLGKISLALLVALAARPGEVLEKRELIAFAWKGRPTEEGNLRAQILRLRRLLGDAGDHDAYIRSVPGRGYRFITGARAPCKVTRLPPPTPMPWSSPIGREADIALVFDTLAQHRLVTLTGQGGVGKSAVAAGVIRQAASLGWQACLIDLALPSQRQSPCARLAQSLHLEADDGQTLRYLDSHVRLVIIDNCEHALDEASQLLGTLLRGTQCLVLATSREPLDMEGETLLRIGALASPPAGDLSLEQAMEYSAFRLFARRLRRAHPQLHIRPKDIEPLARLCRRLDGLPLAIEIAALKARVSADALTELPDLTRLLVATDDTRLLARHRSLAASFEWSFMLLPEAERQLFMALSVCTHGFTLEIAKSLSAELTVPAPPVEAMICSLVNHSLLNLKPHSQPRHYVMSRLARLYALDKLAQSGNQQRVVASYCGYALELLEQVCVDLCEQSTAAWQARYGAEADTIRSALQWSHAESGNRLLGAEICMAMLGVK